MISNCPGAPGSIQYTILLSLLFFCESSSALSCVPRNFTLEEAYQTADSIIIGLVTECARSDSADPWTSGGDECSFVALEVIKDASPVRDYSGVASSSGCGLSLHVGDRYLLYLDENGAPLWYSEPLNAESWAGRLLGARVRIMREYRDSRTQDLSEPWLTQRTPIGTCSLLHLVAGNHLKFSIRPNGATPLEEVKWDEIEVDGRPIISKEQAENLRRQILQSDARPESNVHGLQISFGHRSQAHPRDVVIAIGDRRWKLDRYEVSWSQVHGATDLANQDVTFTYSLRGLPVREILSELETPSDIVVTGTLVLPPAEGSNAADDPNSEPTRDVARGTQGDNSGSAITMSRPRTSSGPATNADGASATESRYRYTSDFLLRFESRSTNVGGAIDDYKQCYESGW